jgi:hypothetical protein
MVESINCHNMKLVLSDIAALQPEDRRYLAWRVHSDTHQECDSSVLFLPN